MKIYFRSLSYLVVKRLRFGSGKLSDDYVPLARFYMRQDAENYRRQFSDRRDLKTIKMPFTEE